MKKLFMSIAAFGLLSLTACTGGTEDAEQPVSSEGLSFVAGTSKTSWRVPQTDRQVAQFYITVINRDGEERFEVGFDEYKSCEKGMIANRKPDGVFYCS